jgi:[NiFe] hydrogenase diaphorase moiety small subunit
MSEIKIKIDGRDCLAKPGQTVLEAARECGIYIPALCNLEGLKPAGGCRICTVRVNGRYAAACTQPAAEGMVVENAVPDIEDLRRSLIEMLFVEGNHICPACEKSGNCELQALAYRYQMLAPRFPFLFPKKEVDAESPGIYLDRNRCILCYRCVFKFETEKGRKVFAVVNRGLRAVIEIDRSLAQSLSEEDTRRAMDICPVGAILKKETGFIIPIGKRKFDRRPIGSDIEEGRGR